mgnify:CR=1 FL=1
MYVSHLSCPKCDATYESENLIQLCKCGAPLLVDYDLLKVQAVFKKENAKGSRAQLVAVPGAFTDQRGEEYRLLG